MVLEAPQEPPYAPDVLTPGPRGKAPPWTTTEDATLRRLYPSEGPAACLAALPRRTLRSIYCRAAGLHLAAHRTMHVPRARWSTSDSIDAAIRRTYQAVPTRGAILELAAAVGRPRWWVTKRAIALGLVHPRCKAPEWSAAELQLLERYCTRPVRAIRRILKREGFPRSDTAIIVRMKRLEIDRKDPNLFSANELARLMGVDSHVVLGWISREGLPAKRRGTNRQSTQGGDTWSITRADLRAWIPTHAQCIDLRKVDRFWFLDLAFNRRG